MYPHCIQTISSTHHPNNDEGSEGERAISLAMRPNRTTTETSISRRSPGAYRNLVASVGLRESVALDSKRESGNADYFGNGLQLDNSENNSFRESTWAFV